MLYILILLSVDRHYQPKMENNLIQNNSKSESLTQRDTSSRKLILLIASCILAAIVIDLVFVQAAVVLAQEDEPWRMFASYGLVAIYFVLSIVATGVSMILFRQIGHQSTRTMIWIGSITHSLVVSIILWQDVLKDIVWFPGA